MSNITKSTATNLFGILDNELARMHDLLKVYLTLPKDPPQYSSSHSSYASHSNMGEIYDRIRKIQDVLIEAAILSDKELQEKVAELALTGSKDGN